MSADCVIIVRRGARGYGGPATLRPSGRMPLPDVHPGLTWSIEGQPRTTEFGCALREEVCAPLWLLTRPSSIRRSQGSRCRSPNGSLLTLPLPVVMETEDRQHVGSRPDPQAAGRSKGRSGA